MKPTWKEMKYFRPLKRWMVIENDQGKLMNSGKCFLLRFGEEKSMLCRLEWDRQWYVICGSDEIQMNLKTTETYQVLV
jgi:hypothetical protein